MTTMNGTAFPVTPGDVAALTPQEFTFDLDELDERLAARSAQTAALEDARGHAAGFINVRVSDPPQLAEAALASER